MGSSFETEQRRGRQFDAHRRDQQKDWQVALIRSLIFANRSFCSCFSSLLLFSVKRLLKTVGGHKTITEAAVQQLKKAAVSELQKAVLAAEQKAMSAVTAERLHMEKTIRELQKQEDSPQVFISELR